MRRPLALPLASVLLLAACSGDGGGDAGDTSDDAVELTVSGASSLTEAFTEIGADFEAENGTAVVFNFGPSDGLASQIRESGGVDVFASASPAWMDAVEEEPGITGRTDFATNRLAVIVPADDPAGIGSLDDLAGPGVKLVLAAEGVPAGAYAREILGNAGIAEAAMANVVSNEADVKGVITKLLSGDGDAGIAYVTDVTAEVADQLRVVEIPDELNVVATYPIAVLADSEHPEEARAFVDFVLGPGQDVLDRYGFLPAA